MTHLLSDLIAPHAPTRDLPITQVTSDSRRVIPGALFAALPGVKLDGRRFIADAVARGAVAVLAEPGAAAGEAVLIEDENPRARLAHIAARFYPRQPGCVVAVTGTNGKSSTVEFLRQIWDGAGRSAASLGTLGARSGSRTIELGHTTPDPVAIHEALDLLAGDGVTHLAMEASSHGLVQHRLDAVKLRAVGFTNLTQDHLDYHPTFEDYFAAKLRLFEALTPAGATAVVNADGDYGARVAQASVARGLDVRLVGWKGRFIKLREVTPRAAGQSLDLVVDGKERHVELPLVGEFQVHNAVMALALALATGVDEATALGVMERFDGVPGRLQQIGRTPAGAPVFVDYAHTPDGLEKLLRALRPHTQGKLLVVFGAGGDRDPTKRGPMGAIAARFSDLAIVADDNPRSEDPVLIRRAILAAAPSLQEIGDRRAAIRHAVGSLRAGDALVVAGKGHETGQIFADHTEHFDDAEEVRAALDAL